MKTLYTGFYGVLIEVGDALVAQNVFIDGEVARVVTCQVLILRISASRKTAKLIRQ